MPFRFSTTFLGRPIVQVSDGERWSNFMPTMDESYEFHIVNVAEFKAMRDRIAKADKHAAACRKSRAKKKFDALPVLTAEAAGEHYHRFPAPQSVSGTVEPNLAWAFGFEPLA
jgi:hypothetical protein